MVKTTAQSKYIICAILVVLMAVTLSPAASATTAIAANADRIFVDVDASAW